MSVEKLPLKESTLPQIIERIKFFLNVINHVCIGFVTIYMTWLCFTVGIQDTMSLHAWLVTIGFSFLMAEAIICHYNGNVLTFSYKRKTKTTIHWVLQVMGGGCGVAGPFLMLLPENFHFRTTHSKFGFAAFVLCWVSMLSGLSALFSGRLRRVLRPLLNKTFHNVVGLACFVMALTAMFYGYHYFHHHVDIRYLRLMQMVTLTTLVLTCIGPLEALYHKTVQFMS